MNINAYSPEFSLHENEDSRKEVYPYILYIFLEGTTITMFLERENYDRLKDLMKGR